MNPVSAAIVAFGVYVNASLYFGFVFVTASNTHNSPSLYAVIAATGITYLSYAAQLMGASAKLVMPLVAATVVLGAASGFLLLAH